MAIPFQPKDWNLAKINGGNQLEPNNNLSTEFINAPVEMSKFAVTTANNTVTRVNDLETRIVEKQGGTEVIVGSQKVSSFNADTKISVGKVTRTATIVVGLESSGYTQGQVDVLIKSTDNVVDKITEAMTRLSSFGGEVKLLEGTYEINKWVPIIHSNITLNGTGTATILKVIGTNEITINAPNISFQNMTITAENESLIIFSYRVNSTNVNWNNITFNINNPNSQNRIIWFPTPMPQGARLDFSNCKTNVPYLTDKTSGNWRNIFVDGLAEFVVLSSNLEVMVEGVQIPGYSPIAGDNIIMEMHVHNSGYFEIQFTQSAIPQIYRGLVYDFNGLTGTIAIINDEISKRNFADIVTLAKLVLRRRL